MSDAPRQPAPAFRIRRATEADCGPIADLLNDQILHGSAHFGTVPEPVEAVRAQWAQWSERYPWLVAADDRGTFLGFARASQWKTREGYHWMTEAGIYMTPAARGRGIGRPLYARLLDTLRAQGYITVVGGVTVGNAASERLHESLGMFIAGEIPMAGYKLGRWWGVRYYQLMLRDLGEGEAPGTLKPVSEAWHP